MYRLYERPHHRLKDQLLAPFGRQYGRNFWALHDVSFEVKRGEMLGIIGRNGSGKSTLLQIIAGVLRPTTGCVKVNGRVGALLELGSGFNFEYTGRENIFVNGSILGLRRSDIEDRLGDILAFADIGEFIDQPVKKYSSGMLMRLAFAVTTSIDPEILLIDEALAVGDIFFRQKCYERLEDLRRKGVSIVLVSHAMADVEQHCERAVLLHQGEPLFQGASTQAVKRYYLLENSRPSNATNHVDDHGQRTPGGLETSSAESASVSLKQVWPDGGDMRSSFPWPLAGFFDLSLAEITPSSSAVCTAVALCDAQNQPCRVFKQGETASFYFEFELLKDIDVPIGGLELRNGRGWIVHGKSTLEYGSAVPSRIRRGERLRFRQDIALELSSGEYTFNVGLATVSELDYEQRGAVQHEELAARLTALCVATDAGQFAIVHRDHASPVALLHHGVANLPGSCAAALLTPGTDVV